MNLPSPSHFLPSLPIVAVLCANGFASTAVHANPELAEKKNCLACHSVEKKIMGPAFKDVAVRYAGQKDITEKLAQKVVKGGGGAWGALPMPANPQVSDAEARQLVQWILLLK